MRLVLCSDLHTDKKTAGFDRFDDVAQAVVQTVDHAIKVKADLWGFLGDLCDAEEGYEVARATEMLIRQTRRLTTNRIAALLLAGNHDVYENSSGRTTLAPLCALGDGVKVFERPGAIMVGDVLVIALPYSPASNPYDMAEYVRGIAKPEKAFSVDVINLSLGERVEVPRTGIVLGHATHTPGVKQGEETLEMPRGRAVTLPLEEIPLGWFIANGHWHTPQTTPSGVHVPGSLCALTFGETHKPRFLEVEI